MPNATELTINTAATAMDMANSIFGPGITVTAASYAGDALSAGIYSGAASTLAGISATDSGVILSTGKVTDFTNSSGTSDTNTVANTGTDTAGVDGDAQLNAVSGMATFDGAILQATFVPDGDFLSMQFVFSSEEYPEHINGGVNDSFGVWVNGTFVPVTITVAGNVAVDAVNAGTSRNFYHDNTADQFNTEMDGFTYTLSLKAPVNAGQSNTLRIGIADGGDATRDSTLLIMGDSIQTVTLAFDDSVNVVANGSRNFDVLANDSNANAGLTITQINGTAVVAGQTVTLATGQNVRLNADGTVTVFANGVIGEESLSYTVSDGTVTDIGYITINTLAAPALDGIVSGTSGDEFIDAFYTGDGDGDRVDNNDATGVQGTTGNGDVIQAGAGNDYVLAGLGDDIVEGGTGNDTVDGGAGNDQAELGAGDDTYMTSDPLAAGNDTVLGEAGNDAVLTGDGNDVIYGGIGNDSLNGGAGNDALYGGDDADRLLAAAGDVVTGGEGGNDNDTLVASGVSTLIYGGGNNEAGTITFSDGRTLTFSQIEKLELNGGNPDGIIYGTAGNDVIGAGFVDANGDVIDNNDSLLSTPQGTNGDEVYAGDGDDTVHALLGDDFVYGGTGNDSIDGGSGNDYMQGDTGNDTVIAGDGNDFIRGDIGNDFVYGGAGDDSTYGGMGNDQVFGGDGNDQMFGGFGNDTVYGGAGNDTITGSGETDIVYGDDGDDSIQGSNGNDTLFGGAGNDTMLGEEDADSFYGGAGDYVDGYETVTIGTDNDSLYVTGVASVVFDTLNSENGVVTFTTGGTLPFYNIENVYVDGVLIGNRSFVVDGTAGGDLIDAGYVDGQGDRIDANDDQAGTNDDIVLAGAGNDTVLSGAGNDQVFADTGDDSITAGAGDDLVYGGDGNDLATGGFGNDTLYGDNGNDDLSGGGVDGSDANDVLYGGAGNDTAAGGAQADTIYGGTGDDVITGGADTAADGRDLLEGGDGNDTILGGFDDDTLIGGAGDDQMSGQSGSDRIVLADGFGSDTGLGGEDAGNTDSDVLDGAGLTKNTVLILSGDEAGVLSTDTGTATFAEIEQIVLGSGRDSVEGYTSTGGFNVTTGGGDDFIGGGSGNDTISAGAGADSVQGGAGADQINLGAADGFPDTLTMRDGDGADVVTGFEGPVDNGNGTFTGRDKISVASMTDASGNPVNVLDVVVGNDGTGNAVLTFPNGTSITLVGVAPASVASPAALIAMGIPAAGDGIVSGTAGGDLIDAGYAGDLDGDRIDANDATLSGAVGNDDLVQAGAGNDTVLAADGNDAVYGAAGDDSLSGGDGTDTLYGEDGNDTILADPGDDVVFGGAGNDALAGGAGNDALTGGTGADVLTGGLGVDTLQGGDDQDTIYGGAGDIVDGGEGGVDADTLHLSNVLGVAYGGGNNEAGTVTFTDNSTLGFQNIETLVFGGRDGVVNGTAGGDLIGVGYVDVQGDAIDANDAVLVGAVGNDDLVQAGAGNDTVTAGGGLDAVYGDAGDDLIDGGTGADSLFGGGDADTFLVSAGGGNDTVVGGETGIDADTLALTPLATPVNLVLTSSEAGTATTAGATVSFTEIERFDLGSGADTFDGTAAISGLGVLGGAGDDGLRGGSGADTFAGGTGNDVIAGNADNDSLNGGAGADTIAGGAGNDQIALGAVDGDRDIVQMADGGGVDTVTQFEAPITNPDGSLTGRDQLDVSELTDATGQPVNTADVLVTNDGNGNAVLSFPNGEAITLLGIAPATLNSVAALIAIGIPAVPDLVVDGTGGNDLMTPGYTDAMGDQIDGTDGIIDTVYGYDGDDTVQAGLGNDLVFGGNGTDQISGDAGDDTLWGDAGDDLLSGGIGNDTLDGGIGNDTLAGGAGNDGLVGALGDDNLSGDAGRDTLSGGDGADTLAGGEEDDLLDGGAENDLLSGDGGNDTLFGDLGNDNLSGGLGNDQLEGGDGNDTIDAGAGDDTLIGGDGDDQLNGHEGRDSLDGSAGNDSLSGWQDDDTLTGGAGDDRVDGGEGNDSLTGGAGNDTLLGDAGSDTLDAGAANDQIYAGAGNDQALGGDGDDQIFGAGGNDTLTGGAGNDTLLGGDDRDTIFGGAGDVVDGGSGGDDYDVLDLSAYRHAGTTITYDSTNPESGTVQFLNAAGDVTGSLAFSDIEKIVACFTLGAMIQTERGEVAVEDLHAGDRVLTRDHGLQPLRWVGRRDLTQAELAKEPRFNPIRIEKDALGNNLPMRDMMVSPQHRMMVSGPRAQLLFGDNEVLVAATHMVGMAGVQRVFPRAISYVHILFDQHQIVLADGSWSESFQPGALTLSGLENAQRDEVLALFPHLTESKAFPSARLKLKAAEARVLLRT